MTQVFSYEAPFLLALLVPAVAAGSWQIGTIATYAESHWLILTQPVGFIVALIGLMGKLEMPPFDAPEAHTEISAGALTEYSGRGLAFFHLAKAVELIIGLTLVAAIYLGGVSNPLWFLVKTLALLLAAGGHPIAAHPPAHRPDRGPVVAVWHDTGIGTMVGIDIVKEDVKL